MNVHQGGSSSDPSSSVSSHEDSDVEYLSFGRRRLLRCVLWESEGATWLTSVESLDGRVGDGGSVGSNAACAAETHQPAFQQELPSDQTTR